MNNTIKFYEMCLYNDTVMCLLINRIKYVTVTTGNMKCLEMNLTTG